MVGGYSKIFTPPRKSAPNAERPPAFVAGTSFTWPGTMTWTSTPRFAAETSAALVSQSGRKYLQREHESGPITRVFEFPSDINPDSITATLEHGMLKIQASKATAARRRVIKLQKEA